MKKHFLFGIVTTALLTGCGGPRLTVVTGTTLGLHATPGDGSTSPPSVTFAYKRAETALVPTSGSAARRGQDPSLNEDAYSTLCVFGADLNWFGPVWIGQLIATGHAARGAATNQTFIEALTGSPPQAAVVAPVAHPQP